MSTKPTTIVAYIGEGDHYRRVEQVAEDQARMAGARLILYDADAASRLAPPLPTWWSGDGSGEMFENRLDPQHLEAAGRQDMADAVQHARSAGIDAWGWLPSSRGANELAEYAHQQHADLLVLPSSLEDIGLLGRLKGESKPTEVEEKAHIPVMTVDVEKAKAS